MPIASLQWFHGCLIIEDQWGRRVSTAKYYDLTAEQASNKWSSNS